MNLTALAAITVAAVAVAQSEAANEDKVEVSLYYESLCPFCAAFYPNIVDLVTKLGPRIDLQTHPYGISKTITENGKVTIKCQHGVKECYLNQVHACAIDVLKNSTTYVLYNACIFKNRFDKDVIDQCGKKQNVDPKPIKTCADGPRGFELHKYHGEQTAKVSFQTVPHVLVNKSELKNHDDGELIKEVCEQFKNPPEACKSECD